LYLALKGEAEAARELVKPLLWRLPQGDLIHARAQEVFAALGT
jgi:hypothetical protein